MSNLTARGVSVFAVALQVTALVGIGVLAYAQDSLGRYGAAAVEVAASASDERVIEILVERAEINGELRTPTWQEFYDAYDQRDQVLRDELLRFNETLIEGQYPASRGTPIPEGTVVRLHLD